MPITCLAHVVRRGLAAKYQASRRGERPRCVVALSQITPIGCVVSSSGVQRGERVLLDLPLGGQMSGEVVSISPKGSAIAFDRELDRVVFATLQSASSPAETLVPLRRLPNRPATKAV